MANQPKKYKKFVATAATATLVASAIVPVASAASFSDVADTNSHAEAINALVEAGIIKGYEDGTFKPNATLTRGHVVKMLGKWVETQGFEIPADYDKVARFTDLAVDAADQELVKYAALVKDTGVFNGLADGSLNAKGDITRENMALTLDRAFKAVFGKTLVELAEGVEDLTVTDLATAKAEAREAIQALRDLEISNVDTFNPKDTVKRGQFASFLHRTINVADAAAKLKVESVTAVNGTLTVKLAEKAEKVEVKDFTVTQAINGGEAKEVTPSKAELAEDGLTVTLTVDKVAVDATKDQSVVYTVNKVAAEAFVVAATPKVESVSAINASQIEVKFNTEVEKKSAEAVANYSITNFTGSQPKAATLKDGKTVVLTLADGKNAADVTALQQTKQKVTVKNVKVADKSATVPTAQFEVTIKDLTLPTVQSATYVGPGEIEVLFSEPVSGTAFKIDGGKYSANNATSNYSTSKVIVKTGELSEGSHEITVNPAGYANAVTDGAGLKAEETTVKFEVVKDVTAPTIATIEAKDQKTVVVTFSEPLKSAPSAADIFHTAEVGAYAATSVTPVADSNNTKFEVKFTNALPVGNAEIIVAKEKAVDKFGNKNTAALKGTVAIVADVVKPVVEKVEVTGKSTVKLTFSKELDATTANNRLNYVVKDKDGKAVGVQGALYNNDDKTVTLTTVSLKEGATYSLEVSNIKDNAAISNTMDKYSTTFTVIDKTAPTVLPEAHYNTTDKVITVYFDEQMDGTSVSDKSKYVLVNANGKELALPEAASVKVINNNTAVEIALPIEIKDNDNNVFTPAKVIVKSVKDMAGNTSKTATEVALTTAVTAIDLSTATAEVQTVDTRTVKFELKQPLKSIEAADFLVDGKVVESANFTNGTLTDGSYGAIVTLQVKKADKWATSATPVVKTKASDVLTTALNGAKLKADTQTAQATDNVAPEMTYVDADSKYANITSIDSDANQKIDKLKITFSEALKAGSVSVDDFDVVGYEVEDVALVSGDAKTVELTLKEGSVEDLDVTVNVTLKGDIADAEGNVLKADISKVYKQQSSLQDTLLGGINSGTATDADYTVLGIKDVTSGNVAAVNEMVKHSKTVKGSALTTAEIQTAVQAVNYDTKYFAKKDSTGVNSWTEKPFDGKHDLAYFGLEGKLFAEGNKLVYKVTGEIDVASKITGQSVSETVGDVEKIALALYVGKDGEYNKVAKYFGQEMDGTWTNLGEEAIKEYTDLPVDKAGTEKISFTLDLSKVTFK